MADDERGEITAIAAAWRMVHLYICSRPDLELVSVNEFDSEVEQLAREVDPVELASAFISLLDLALTVDGEDRRIEFDLTMYYTLASVGQNEEGSWLMQ